MPKTTMTIRRILRLQPCSYQARRVKELYPKGIPLTWDALKEAMDQHVWVHWGAARFLGKTRLRPLAKVVFELQKHKMAPAMMDLLLQKPHGELVVDYFDIRDLWTTLGTLKLRNTAEAWVARTHARKLHDKLYGLVHLGGLWCGDVDGVALLKDVVGMCRIASIAEMADSWHPVHDRYCIIDEAEDLISAACRCTGSHELAIRWILEHVFRIPQPIPSPQKPLRQPKRGARREQAQPSLA